MIDPLERLDRAFNPDESEGVILDWIGLRLGLPRPFVTAADAVYFGMAGTMPAGGRPWDQAPFYSLARGIEDVEPVGDATYRKLLKARARRLRGGADRETIEAVLDILFGDGYLDETVTPITMRVDTGDEITFLLASTRTFEKVIPRPAGTEITFTRI